MPSPFPGMDPFIESQAWPDFHLGLIAFIRELLTPEVRPRYVVRGEERIYLEHKPEERPKVIRPDISVLKSEERNTFSEATTGSATAMIAEPLLLNLPIPEPQEEVFLTIRDRETMEVVTIIEVLSPGNKRRGGDGRIEYLNKREKVLRSFTHLVELDLLRRGQRLPTIEPLPSADYYAFVCRGRRRPSAEVYRWSIRDRLPSIPIPLAQNDPDVVIDLQKVFDTVYDRAGYDYSLNYSGALEPMPIEAETTWVKEILASINP